MSKQEFGVVFNSDPSRPIGVIDGFKQKNREGLVPPSRMKDVLDDRTSVYVRGVEYVIDESGSVIGASVRERIDDQSGTDTQFEIGEGVFIAEGVHFNRGIGERPYRIAGGSAIGHRFRSDGSYHIDGASSHFALPAVGGGEAEALLTSSLSEDPERQLTIDYGFTIGESAVLWCIISKNMETMVGNRVEVQDRAQVFAAAIGNMTRIDPDTIIGPSRGMIGEQMVIGPGSERSG